MSRQTSLLDYMKRPRTADEEGRVSPPPRRSRKDTAPAPAPATLQDNISFALRSYVQFANDGKEDNAQCMFNLANTLAAQVSPPRAKRGSYSYTQKIQALRDIAGSSCSLISQRTEIPISTLKTWRSQSKAIRDAIARGWGRFHREPEPRTYKLLYEHLYKMFVATREVLLVVNCAVVCMWADKFSQDFRGAV